MSIFTAIRPSLTKSSPERIDQRAGSVPTVAPFVDVFENDSEILLWADVPGATKDGVEVHIDKGLLTLSARRPVVTPEGARPTPLEVEQRSCDYQRVFTVPSGIDAGKIDAELSAGVLKVRLPKSESLKPRKVNVRAA